MSKADNIIRINWQQPLLNAFQSDMENELEEILFWWVLHTKDILNGGYYGKVNDANLPDPSAVKGLVLHSRILWTYSAAGLSTGDDRWIKEANYAYNYLMAYFEDKEWGGFFWSVHPDGTIANDQKKVYGQAFVLYALVEYFKLSQRQEVLNKAIELFHLLEKHTHDIEYGGYTEAFTRDWLIAADFRLSEKELNVSKTMNTHLHVAEAFANLYMVWKAPLLQSRLKELLKLFHSRIIDQQKLHLHLFFTADWSLEPAAVSFGHDIEAAWLLLDCARKLGIEKWIWIFENYALHIANNVIPALDADAGLWYEHEPGQDKWIKEKHWWVQAEAMLGFFNAWELSGESRYLDLSWQCWHFVKSKLKVPAYGEWYWGLDEDNLPMQGQDKAGFWKCPYHNGRACMLLIQRISTGMRQG